MSDDKGVPSTSVLTLEQLGNMLLDPSTRPAAEAEMRIVEHRAILSQAESAERAAVAAERQAMAAERGTKATVTYVRLTFGLLVFTALTGVAALAGLQHSCAGGPVSPPPTASRPAT